MRPANDDPVRALARLAAGDAESPEDVARAAEIRRLRPLVAEALAGARVAEAEACATAGAVVVEIEAELARALALLEKLAPRRTEAYRRADAVAGQYRRAVEKLERLLMAPATLPAELRELEARLRALSDLRNIPSTWPDVSRTGWLRDLTVAGEAFARLPLTALSEEGLTAMRKTLDALDPSAWSDRHPAPPEPVAAAPEEFVDARHQRAFR